MGQLVLCKPRGAEPRLEGAHCSGLRGGSTAVHGAVEPWLPRESAVPCLLPEVLNTRSVWPLLPSVGAGLGLLLSGSLNALLGSR